LTRSSADPTGPCAAVPVGAPELIPSDFVSIRYSLSIRRRLTDELLERALDQQGFVTTRNAGDLEIDPTQLRLMASRGRLEHVDRGLYRFPQLPTTHLAPLMEAVLRVGHDAVISHESALIAYELADCNPSRVHLTVPTRFRATRTYPHSYQLWSTDLTDRDRTTLEGLPIVTVERALVEAIATGSDPYQVRMAIREARGQGALSTAVARRLTDRLHAAHGGRERTPA
jgi:predicted transcriptional regulator of viral defense system